MELFTLLDRPVKTQEQRAVRSFAITSALNCLGEPVKKYKCVFSQLENIASIFFSRSCYDLQYRLEFSLMGIKQLC